MKRIQFNMILTGCGIVMILCAIILTAYNISDSARAYRSANYALEQLYDENPVMKSQAADENTPAPTVEVPDYILNPTMGMPKITVGEQDYIGTLSIPSLEIELPVISGWDYEKLKLAPCQYSGSVYSKNMVIAAHNYSCHFGRIKNASIGDDVMFVDADGNIFQYEVSEIELLDAESVEEMINSDYPLTLFTCNYAGNMRITLRCLMSESE